MNHKAKAIPERAKKLKREVIRNKVIEIVARVKRVEPQALGITDQQDFISDLAIDSLDAVNLTIELGSTFGFSFGEELEDLDALSSFGSLLTLVERRSTISA